MLFSVCVFVIKYGSRSTPVKFPPERSTLVYSPKECSPPTLFRLVARVRIEDSSRNRFVSTAYFTQSQTTLFLCILFMGGMFRGGNNRGGSFWGKFSQGEYSGHRYTLYSHDGNFSSTSGVNWEFFHHVVKQCYGRAGSLI